MVAVHLWSSDDTATMLRVPSAADNKYSRGVVGLRTGSPHYPGAAVLGVEGAWRSGAGLVRYLGDELPRTLVLARRPETVVVDGRADAWVIGSGTDATHRTNTQTEALRALLAGTVPVVVDAGALDLVSMATAPLVVTPHAGEFARLRSGLGLAEAPEGLGRADRAAVVVETAHALGGTVVLKGAETIVADEEGALIVIQARTSWLAAAGTGDVLSGMIGALVAANSRASLAESAAAAVWLHAEAGAFSAGVKADAPGHPVIALEVAEAVPAVIAQVLAR